MYRAEYKCRMCGRTYTQGYMEKPKAIRKIYRLIGEIESLESIPRERDVHYCSDGSLGYSDFIGYKRC